MIWFLLGAGVMCGIFAVVHMNRWAMSGAGGWAVVWNIAGAALALAAIPVVLVVRLVV